MKIPITYPINGHLPSQTFGAGETKPLVAGKQADMNVVSGAVSSTQRLERMN